MAAVKLVLVVLSLYVSCSFSAGTNDFCPVVPQSCEFYECVESDIPCGPDGYAIGYGYHYCTVYLENLSNFSPQGQQWVLDVLLCLQNTLAPMVSSTPTPDCSAVKTFAYNSHPGCYLGTADSGPSVCFLPSDWPEILKIVWKGLLSEDGAIQVWETGTGCFSQYFFGQMNLDSNEDLTSTKSKIANLVGTEEEHILILDSPVQERSSDANLQRNIKFTFYAKHSAPAQNLHSTNLWNIASLEICNLSSAGCYRKFGL